MAAIRSELKPKCLEALHSLFLAEWKKVDSFSGNEFSCSPPPPLLALEDGMLAGGRFVRRLENRRFSITGLNVSEQIVNLAAKNHPEHHFLHQDICTWETTERFDFIVAWDSIFHLPIPMHKPVLAKLCGLLANEGVLIYTFGNAEGEHTDQWRNDTFYYSSIGITENLQLLINSGLLVLHLELDQNPENHVYAIAKRA